MIIENGKVLDNDFILRKKDLFIDGETIANNTSGERIDATGLFVLPGFIDTHIHGAAGVRFSDSAPNINKITSYEATQGVTSIAATTASSDFDGILKQLELISSAAKSGTEGARIEGIHSEGPFLNKKYKGAMTAEYIIEPDIEKCDAMYNSADGMLKIITIAPEVKNAKLAIEYFVSKDVVVSMGHTNATFSEAKAGADYGASLLTHTFNAMRGLNHREPGILGFSLTDERIKCEMICDFVHLNPAIVKFIYNAKGAENINIVSDTGHAAGADMTEFEVDGVMRYIKNGVVRLADGTIAGSAMSLLGGIKNLLSLGVPIADISRMASLNPAKTLGISDRTGSLEIGKYADIILLNEDFDVVMTIVGGKVVYKSLDI